MRDQTIQAWRAEKWRELREVEAEMRDVSGISRRYGIGIVAVAIAFAAIGIAILR